MRAVCIAASAQTDHASAETELDAPEMAFRVAKEAVERSGLRRADIGLTVSASSDVLEGRPFGFLQGIEALGIWPATAVAHLDMDGAWAAYYAWTRILAGACDSALVVAWGKTSEASLHHVTNAQLDPFCLAPLGLDALASAALQADAYLARAGTAPEVLDAVVERSREAARRNPKLARMIEPDDAPAASPLRRRHCSQPADGACAVVLAAAEVAPRAEAWIAGADHRTESGALGHRDLSRLPSARAALGRARAVAGWRDFDVDVAELGASFAHQEPLLVEELGLGPGTALSPSGGPLACDPVMATGLIRLAEASSRITAGARALAHASAGHAMQQNIVWLLQREKP